MKKLGKFKKQKSRHKTNQILFDAIKLLRDSNIESEIDFFGTNIKLLKEQLNGGQCIVKLKRTPHIQLCDVYEKDGLWCIPIFKNQGNIEFRINRKDIICSVKLLNNKERSIFQ